MTTIYSGIHQKLNSHLTPWPDKLKLARFAWVSSQCFLLNKEQFLFDWVARALSGYYSKKIEVPQEVVEGLWTYLNEILHSKKLCNVLSTGKAINIPPAIPQMINERILDSTSGTLSVNLSTILSCCEGILALPVLAVAYTAKYELLVELVVRLNGLACFQLQQQESTELLSVEVFEVLLLVLSTYLTVQRQQGNPKRVFVQVTERLLQPLCLLRHLLTSRTWTEKDDKRIRQHMSREIRSKVDLILQSALYYHEHLQYYKEEVLPSERASGGRKGSTSKTFLCPAATILSKLVQGHDANESFYYGVQSSALPMLFKYALDAFCKGGENKLVCFHLMTKFLTALDFTEDLNVKETFNETNWSFALLSLENILNSCLAEDIYNVAADKIHHGEVQLKFYRKVAQLLFNNAQTGIPAWYRCLKILLALNHQILEPDLDELVSLAWVDADNTELRVKKAQETLVCAVLQTYAKLRQLPRLIEELLVVICRPAADELRQELLPEALQNCLGQCLLDSPPSQNLEICRLILEKMQNDLPYVQEGRRDSALKMYSLSVLMHAVVFSLKTLDDSTPLPVVRQTQSLMEEMLKFVRDLLQRLEGILITDSLWVEKVQEASLLLTHTWHEADALFQIHCSKYTSPAGSTGDVSPVSDTVQKVLALRESGVQVTSPLSRFLQKLLALHRMKRQSLVSPTSLTLDTNTHDVLCETAQIVVNSQELSVNPYTVQTWDRQLCSINSDTYPVAFWFLVTANLPLIAPYLTQEVTAHIADTIVNSLLQGHSRSNIEKSDLSFLLISKQLLESTVLCELPNLHSAVVTSITDRIFGLPSASDVRSFCPSFFKSCTEIGVASESKEGRIAEISSSFNRLKATAQDIVDCAKNGAHLPISETQADTLLQLVRITSVLNPYAISPEDYLGLFLGLFLMTLCVQRNENGALSVPVSLLKELFGLMDSLLVGKNSHAVLKVVHGSMLLEAAMTSLFSRLDKNLFQSVDSSAWFSFHQSVQAFIHSIINVILDRKSSMRINLDKFTTFMIDRACTIDTSSVDSGTCDKALYSFQLHLATLSTLCNEMMSVLGKNPQLDETLTQLLGKIISVMGPATQAALMGTAYSGLRQSFSIDVVTVMIKSELAKVSHETQDIIDADQQHKLSNMTLYNSFGQRILEEIYPAPQPMEFLISSLQYLSAFYAAAEKTQESDLNNLYIKIVQSVYKLLSSAWLSVSEVKELEVPLRELLTQLMVSSSEEQLQSLFLMIRNGLVASQIEVGCHKDVFATVTLIKLLASCSMSETSSETFWRVVPYIMSSLVFVVRASGQVPSLTSVLTVPVVETLTILLRQGETHLSDPHHVILVLGALEFVPLESQCMADYYSAFQAIHEALYVIILCYTKVMLKASPVFLNCFYRLVASIIREGRQKGENEKGKDSEKLLKCAMLVERMYTHIGTTAEGFTLLNSFIVAQYVTELQKVTLQPEIKTHLTEGIYCILDQCVKQDIKFLNRTLSLGVKEVFSELYKNYTHYHKSQRQGEEKYTV